MRLIMFDMDGTLIESGAIIHEHMPSTLRARGFGAPIRERSHAATGLDLEKAMEQVAGVDENTAMLLTETYHKQYRSMPAQGDRHEALYPGARETVEKLARQSGTLLGIATGKALRGVHRVLALHRFAEHFVTLQTPDHNPGKPHPGMLLRAMAETGVDPHRTVMVGDTSFDMALAKAARARAIGVTWGYHRRAELEDAGADIIIADYGQLDAAIEKVLS